MIQTHDLTRSASSGKFINHEKITPNNNHPFLLYNTTTTNYQNQLIHFTMSDKLAARERFLDVFEDLVEELKQILVSYNMPQEAIEWFVRSLNYNTQEVN